MLADQFSHSLVLPCWQIASAIVWVCRLNWQLTIPVNSKRRFRISIFITPILNHPFQFSLPPKRPPAFSWIRFHALGGRGDVLWGRFYAREFDCGRGSAFSGQLPEFDLATDSAAAPPRENDDGGRPYVARNASLNRRTLRNPAAKAIPA